METASDSPSTFKTFTLDGLERLKAPHDPSVRTYIPFGFDGIAAIITPFGEILKLSQFFREEPRLVEISAARATNAFQLQDISQNLMTGIGLYLRPFQQENGEALSGSNVSDEEDEEKPPPSSSEPELEWVNDRWPRISFETAGVKVTVQFVISDGCLVQQYILNNESNKNIDLQLDLQWSSATLFTRFVREGNSWEYFPILEGHQVGGNVNSEHPNSKILPESRIHSAYNNNSSYKFSRREDKRSDAGVFAFIDGHPLDLAEDISSANLKENETKLDSSVGKAQLRLLSYKRWVPLPKAGGRCFIMHAKESREIVLQYKIALADQLYKSSVPFSDIGTFLKNDWPGYPALIAEEKLNAIYRRHLEHALCGSRIVVAMEKESKSCVAFRHDLVDNSPSGLSSDLAMFRFLILMYEYVSSSFADGRGTKERLLTRIRDTCEGHMRWCMKKEIFFSGKSWLFNAKSDDKTSKEEKSEIEGIFAEFPGSSLFNGSVHFIMIFEYVKAFGVEDSFVKRVLEPFGYLWLDALAEYRNRESGLWDTLTTTTYINWEGCRNEGADWIKLPKYDLGQQIYIWRSLQVLLWLVDQVQDDGIYVETLLSHLKRLDLLPKALHNLILQRFVCLEGEDIDQNGPGYISGTNQNSSETQYPSANQSEKTIEKDEASPRSFVALDRSAKGERILFYYSDRLVYDGLQWGYIQKGMSVWQKSAKRSVEIDLEAAWRETLKGQENNTEAIWKNAISYAIDIGMKSQLPSNKMRDELPALIASYLDKISRGALPSGLLARTISWRTKLPDVAVRYGLQVNPETWHVASVMLIILYPDLSKKYFSPIYVTEEMENKLANADEKKSWINESSKARSRTKKGNPPEMLTLEKRRDMRSHRWFSAPKFDSTQINDSKARKLREWLFPPTNFLLPRKEGFKLTEELSDLSAKFAKADDENPVKPNETNILRKAVHMLKTGHESLELCDYATAVAYVFPHSTNPNVDTYDSTDLCDLLQEFPKTPLAKKQFYYMAPLAAAHALLVYLATPKNQRTDLLKFFSRHQSAAIEFHENVHQMANRWITEFHIGFVQIKEITKDEFDSEEYGREEAANICNGYQRKYSDLISGKYHTVFTAALGYRFAGDLMDRSWLGIFLADLPNGSALGNAGTMSPVSFSPDHTVIRSKWFAENAKHEQRKVLEPFIVEKMASEAFGSTEEVLQALQTWLDSEQRPVRGKKVNFGTQRGKPKGGAGGEDRFGYESSAPTGLLPEMRDFNPLNNRSKMCLDINALLNNVQCLSHANKDCLRQWIEREKYRGTHKPRWSEKDEIRYGEFVDYQERHVRQQYDLLSDQCDRIKILLDHIKDHRQFLADRLQLLESRTAAYSAEKVRIFTYVTVVFLPLSFVSSICSMQGLPDSDTVGIFLQSLFIALIAILVVIFTQCH